MQADMGSRDPVSDMQADLGPRDPVSGCEV